MNALTRILDSSLNTGFILHDSSIYAKRNASEEINQAKRLTKRIIPNSRRRIYVRVRVLLPYYSVEVDTGGIATYRWDGLFSV